MKLKVNTVGGLIENQTLRILIYFLNDIINKKAQIIKIRKQATASHLPNFVDMWNLLILS